MQVRHLWARRGVVDVHVGRLQLCRAQLLKPHVLWRWPRDGRVRARAAKPSEVPVIRANGRAGL